MDGDRFDHLARTMADGVPRREVVKTAAASGLAALLARVGFDSAEAKKKKILQKCDGDPKCKGQQSGSTRCRELTRLRCAELFPGKRCCKTEGTQCNPNLESCDCCGELSCLTTGMDTTYRCLDVPT